MAASAQDAHPFPIYNARFRMTIPILDPVSGSVVTGVSADTELSQDGGNFADATNECTEIQSTGIYNLDLLGSELDTTSTVVLVKQGATYRASVITLQPRRLPVIKTGTCQSGNTDTIILDAAARSEDDYYNGCYINCTNNTPTNVVGQCRKILDYVGSTRACTVATLGTAPTSGTTFEILLGPESVNCVSWVGKLLSSRFHRWFSARNP